MVNESGLPTFREFYRERNYHPTGHWSPATPYDLIITEMMDTVADYADLIAKQSLAKGVS
jgi:hypothetical protein